MGADIKFRPSAFEEAFLAVQGLLRGETVSGSRRFKFRDARVTLLPAEPVEYWVGASAQPAIDRAARLGDGWIASPAITLEEARTQLGNYLERSAAHGRKPTAIAIRRDIYIGESEQDAEEVAKRVMEKGYRGFRRAALVIGSVDKVIQEFRSFAAAGYTDLIVRHVTLYQPRVLGSMARLSEVRQALKDA
jgi:alkanesulfonate monooxygenase SsuD/methylene tetrahydromethanopterin reductase-like flavin-dependent oxidoreductase (luciferase family)